MNATTEDRQAAFERLFARTSAPVRAYVARRAEPASVEDILSEVFLIAWRRFDDLGGDPLPWLFGVARRVLANDRRADRRRSALGDRLRREPERQDPGWRPPASLRDEMVAAIHALTPAEREALLLVAWEGLTPARAATAAGCSRAAFRVRLHRARRHVAAALASDDRHPATPSLTEGAR